MNTLALLLLIVALTPSVAAQQALDEPALLKALDRAIVELDGEIAAAPKDVPLRSRRGDALFFRGRFHKSVADYDVMLRVQPASRAGHWRRGLALFYACRYGEAAQQFAAYHSYDDVDRENGIWRYFSQYRAFGRERAKKELLRYTKDDRPPFVDLWSMLRGELTAEALLERIEKAKISGSQRSKRRFYAHMYVGINDDIEGRRESALEHLRKAVATPWGRNSGFGPGWMWQVARVHRDVLEEKLARRKKGEVEFELLLSRARSGYDGKNSWVHARGGAIPPGAPGNAGAVPKIVMTMQTLRVDRSDVFSGVHDLMTDDLGASWGSPRADTALARKEIEEGVLLVPGDLTPAWHAKSRTLLATGKTFHYQKAKDDHVPNAVSQVAYATLDATAGTWRPWKALALPEEPRFEHASAGCTQRLDLESGEVLLPFVCRERKSKFAMATVARCAFDGETLRYLEHGDVLEVPRRRGLAEPSIARFAKRYFLTLRHDERGYVTRGTDGLRWEPIRPWQFDDGTELGSYNTQQHWIARPEALWLVYTRRGADNDHVFRHRAPLFVARVDPERLVVVRASERVLVPERGARLGNFGVVEVSPGSTWITAAEWMQPRGVERHGSDNSVWIAELRWPEH